MQPQIRASRMTSRMIAVLAMLCAVHRATAQSLRERLDQRLDAPGLEHLLWGVAVTDLDGHLLYGRNADRLLIPASNMKLIVSTVANSLLGPSFTVKTSVYATGPIGTSGVVDGDVILYGRGDPTFSHRCYDADTTKPGVCDRDPAAKLHMLAQQLHDRGVRVIAGDLVGDGSYFTPEVIHPAWENYDLGWWYAAPVSGLGFNDNSVDFAETAGDAIGHPPQLVMTPDLGAFSLENRADVERGARRTFDIFRAADGKGYFATGTLPAGAATRYESAAVVDPNWYAAIAFRHELEGAGITVRGAVRSTIDSLTYENALTTPPLAEVTSRPLRDWLYPILSPSQNWFAEMLMKQVGRRFGTSGSWEEGRRIERRFLIDSVGIDSTEFSIQDGSGLAANNYVTPLAFTKLLRFAYRHPGFEAIHAALPQSGKPGTLRERFNGTAAAGTVHAKTGSISGVNTLSGFIERPGAPVLVFSVMANHHTLGGNRMIAMIDSVVSELAKP